jgi:hypothetical protein
MKTCVVKRWALKIDKQDDDKDNSPTFSDCYCDYIWSNLAGYRIVISNSMSGSIT